MASMYLYTNTYHMDLFYIIWAHHGHSDARNRTQASTHNAHSTIQHLHVYRRDICVGLEDIGNYICAITTTSPRAVCRPRNHLDPITYQQWNQVKSKTNQIKSMGSQGGHGNRGEGGWCGFSTSVHIGRTKPWHGNRNRAPASTRTQPWFSLVWDMGGGAGEHRDITTDRGGKCKSSPRALGGRETEEEDTTQQMSEHMLFWSCSCLEDAFSPK